MSRPKILAFAGSARRDSFNKKLIQIAVKGAQEAGAEVTLLDLADFPMPLYDGDLEAEHGIPENVKTLKELFLAHQGLLLSCPEYNSSITPLLKNTIDWVSRPVEGEGRLAAYQGKVCALMSASPGALGGLRGLVHVRAILQNIGVIVLPKQMAISQANNAFADDGSLKDSQQQETTEGLGKSLCGFLEKLQ
ncbi:FMN-dependent NADPH-azoreductase [Bremerella volcania]|uniref:FMN-dependent NADPH-azoreductase n=1 Tax=Bremerella volcania TaxID=2527984 RepID=A0A518CG19_9BACT|nr:NAD(P)H-dependent oxidoreductase [Bremerella volcania]QDU78114.1 FMN-dependent NADPH-azoreductase [Bremerella volcania]